MVVYNVSMFIDRVEMHVKSRKCGDGMAPLRNKKFVHQGRPVFFEVNLTLGEFDLKGQD